MKNLSLILSSLCLAALIAGCGDSEPEPGPSPEGEGPPVTFSETPPVAVEGEDHEHDEQSLGTVTMGELAVELAQGHGPVVAGEEGHLVVKLPYNDAGATVVRAWIGTDDRTLSYVGKGEYAASHDDYDVHATAPDPLPADPKWWVEIVKPDGTKILGSVTPILE